MDVGTIVTALFVIGAFALFLVLMRRLPPAEDDVAVVVAAIMPSPIEPGLQDRAEPEESVRWRTDLLKPPAASRSPFGRSAAPPAKSDRRVPKLATPSHRSTSTP